MQPSASTHREWGDSVLQACRSKACEDVVVFQFADRNQRTWSGFWVPGVFDLKISVVKPLEFRHQDRDGELDNQVAEPVGHSRQLEWDVLLDLRR
ncbi:hypothetical protein C6P77_06285 [Burkholderia ambifaria]|nr:hypothetical protein C6P77_06285 [Burkholderia ambifaria]